MPPTATAAPAPPSPVRPVEVDGSCMQHTSFPFAHEPMLRMTFVWDQSEFDLQGRPLSLTFYRDVDSKQPTVWKRRKLRVSPKSPRASITFPEHWLHEEQEEDNEDEKSPRFLPSIGYAVHVHTREVQPDGRKGWRAETLCTGVVDM